MWGFVSVDAAADTPDDGNQDDDWKQDEDKEDEGESSSNSTSNSSVVCVICNACFIGHGSLNGGISFKPCFTHKTACCWGATSKTVNVTSLACVETSCRRRSCWCLDLDSEHGSWAKCATRFG